MIGKKRYKMKQHTQYAIGMLLQRYTRKNSLSKQLIRHIAGQFRDQGWVQELLRARGTRDIRTFLRRRFALVAIVACIEISSNTLPSHQPGKTSTYPASSTSDRASRLSPWSGFRRPRHSNDDPSEPVTVPVLIQLAASGRGRRC